MAPARPSESVNSHRVLERSVGILPSSRIHRSNRTAPIVAHQVRSETNTSNATASRENQLVHVSAEEAADGCVSGIPVVVGLPAFPSCTDPETDDLAILRSIHANDFRFIRHMIMKGWRPNVEQCAGFTLTVDAGSELKTWEVANATPLQYSLCCGSFASAAVFFIAFPDQAELKCTATNAEGEVRLWDSMEISIFLATLCLPSRVQNALQYQSASLLLIRQRARERRVAFIDLATPFERLQAAGDDAQAAMDALFVEVQPSNPPVS